MTTIFLSFGAGLIVGVALGLLGWDWRYRRWRRRVMKRTETALDEAEKRLELRKPK